MFFESPVKRANIIVYDGPDRYSHKMKTLSNVFHSSTFQCIVLVNSEINPDAYKILYNSTKLPLVNLTKHFTEGVSR